MEVDALTASEGLKAPAPSNEELAKDGLAKWICLGVSCALWIALLSDASTEHQWPI